MVYPKVLAVGFSRFAVKYAKQVDHQVFASDQFSKCCTVVNVCLKKLASWQGQQMLGLFNSTGGYCDAITRLGELIANGLA